MKTETTSTSPAVVVHNPPAPYRGENWETLVATSQEVYGADLERGDTLIGIPFCIVAATFRPGDFMRPGTDAKGDYVSLDVVIGSADEIARGIRRRRITDDRAMSVDPGEHLVINEAGTGAYRQIVAYLEAESWIQLPEGPAEGRLGESRFDTPVSDWRFDRDVATATVKPDGSVTLGFNLRILCPRGLRASEYENEYTKTGVTRYIA